jgi:hypothetical protein
MMLIKVDKNKDENSSAVLDIDIKEIQYPFYFERKNICVSCGAEGSLKFINIFGKESTHEVHPFESLKCSRCGASYSIKWDRDKETDKLYPSAVDKKITTDFLNMFKKSDDKEKVLN